MMHFVDIGKVHIKQADYMDSAAHSCVLIAGGSAHYNYGVILVNVTNCY